MPEPLISVLLPCRDAESGLAESLTSMQRQTRTDFEVIIYDDGSTDASRRIADRFARRDNRFRVIASGPVGIVEALARASGEVRGAFIARMDADDIAEPERFARQIAFMQANPEVGLCGTGVRGFGAELGPGRRRYESWLNALVHPDEVARELFIECPVAHPTFMLRRAAFEAAGGYQDRGWPEDYDLAMRVWLAGWKAANVPETLLRWRHSSGRMSAQCPRYSLANFRALKRHYLSMSYLEDGRPFYQWGAGEVGKVWLREWDGWAPMAAVDINPRKLGRTIHNVPVIPPEELPGPGEAFVLVAVGAPGAREDIRAWFCHRGYIETRDFLFIA